MGLSVRQRANRIGSFRYISVNLMEALASWIPTTPELEAKVLFGRHVWEFAQHADLLGRRTGELRRPTQYSHPPLAAYRSLLDALASRAATGERIAGLYDVLLPDLERRYAEYVAATDRIGDEPSVRIIARILSDLARMVEERSSLSGERPDLASANGAWAAEYARRLASEVTIFDDAPDIRNGKDAV